MLPEILMKARQSMTEATVCPVMLRTRTKNTTDERVRLLRGLLLLRWAWLGLLLWDGLFGRPRSSAGEGTAVDGSASLSG